MQPLRFNPNVVYKKIFSVRTKLCLLYVLPFIIIITWIHCQRLILLLFACLIVSHNFFWATIFFSLTKKLIQLTSFFFLFCLFTKGRQCSSICSTFKKVFAVGIGGVPQYFLCTKSRNAKLSRLELKTSYCVTFCKISIDKTFNFRFCSIA